MGAEPLEWVRQQAGLSQDELASGAGTSRTTLSAYEHGRKSPTLTIVKRLLDSAGFELAAEPKVTFCEVPTRRGRLVFVADRLWRLPICDAFSDVALPLELNWSHPGTVFRLSDRRERARCYDDRSKRCVSAKTSAKSRASERSNSATSFRPARVGG